MHQESPRRLIGKIAIVTGGSHGIGFSIVTRLLQEGCAKVFVVDNNLVDSKEQRDEGIEEIEADISDGQQVANLMSAIGRKASQVDILVNNAACFLYETADKVTEAALDRCFAVNVKGTALMTKHVVPLMKHGGAIVNMSSVNAEIALPGFVPYAVSKAAISQLTRNSALDLGKFNIRVNTINPGPILTAATQHHGESQGKTLDEMVEELTSHLIIKRMGKPEEVAATVAFLVSDDGGFITGTTITVDGGYTFFH